jgi:nicotinamide-nucleotide amidase
LDVVETMLKKRGRPMSPAQRKQALVPEGVQVLKNPNGTAPGLFLRRTPEIGEQFWAIMPGVPKEMLAMLKDDVLARLPGDAGYRTRHWATHFVAEAALQDRLRPLIEKLPAGFELSFRTRYPENHVGLHASCPSSERLKSFEEVSARISEILGTDAFSVGTELEEIESLVLAKARITKTWIACMESCTGGLIAKKFTSVPGSSEHFYASWTTYHNEAKIGLGVSRELVQKHGAVSAEVARSMAEAGLSQLHKGVGDGMRGLCVSTTGIAGPGGGTDTKPVGLCYVALAQTGRETETIELRAAPGLTRDWYQMYFAQKALDLLRLRLIEIETSDLRASLG